MLHLAIECSALAGSVAILQQQTLITERQLPPNIGSVVSLAPTIAELLAQYCSGSSAQVELISVTHGPGSFTGLRAGLATAKMLGLAWKIPLVTVDTLQVIAARSAQVVVKNFCEAGEELGAEANQPVVVAVLNAFRKQVFAAAWCVSTDGPQPKLAPEGLGLTLKPLATTQVLDAPLWQAQPLSSLENCARDLRPPSSLPPCSPPALPPNSHPSALEQNSQEPRRIWISGPGLRTYTPQSDSRVNLIDQSAWDPVAGWVGRLGWQNYLAGQAVSAAELCPNYVRRSAAEEARSAAET